MLTRVERKNKGSRLHELLLAVERTQTEIRCLLEHNDTIIALAKALVLELQADDEAQHDTEGDGDG